MSITLVLDPAEEVIGYLVNPDPADMVMEPSDEGYGRGYEPEPALMVFDPFSNVPNTGCACGHVTVPVWLIDGKALLLHRCKQCS